MDEAAKLNKSDKYYHWRANARKGRIEISWGYFDDIIEGIDNKFIIIESGESTTKEPVLVAVDPYGNTVSARLVGSDFYHDGNAEECIRQLFGSIFRDSQTRW